MNNVNFSKYLHLFNHNSAFQTSIVLVLFISQFCMIIGIKFIIGTNHKLLKIDIKLTHCMTNIVLLLLFGTTAKLYI